MRTRFSQKQGQREEDSSVLISFLILGRPEEKRTVAAPRGHGGAMGLVIIMT